MRETQKLLEYRVRSWGKEVKDRRIIDEIRVENHRRWYVLNKKAYSLSSAKLIIFDTTEIVHSPLARYVVSEIVKNLRGVKQNETT